MLQRLLAHAAKRPAAYTVRPQVEAITSQRLLLAEPDPVKPLLDALTADLRQALQDARQRVVDLREQELTALRDTAEWNKLSDEQWRDILHAQGLGLIAELQVGTDDLLLAALDAKPLDAWATDALQWRTLTGPLVLGRSVIVGDSTGLVHMLSREDGSPLNRLSTDGSTSSCVSCIFSSRRSWRYSMPRTGCCRPHGCRGRS